MHAKFEKYNPKRTPTWRFDRLTLLLANNQQRLPNPKWDDEYVIEAFKFLRKLNKAQNEEEQARCFQGDPGLFYAHLIYQDEDPHDRRAIETRLLSQQTDPEIAEAVGTLDTAITWYERLFYNVRDRYQCRDWIVKQALGSSIDRLLAERSDELWEKMVAYFMGPYMYEWVSHKFGRRNWIEQDADFAAVAHLECDRTVPMRAMMGIKTVDINRFNLIGLIERQQNLQEMAANAHDKELTKTMVEENIQGMLKEIPWLVGLGAETQRVLSATPLAPYENFAAELRADEMLALASGRPVLSIAGLETKKLREPRPDAHGNAQQGS